MMLIIYPALPIGGIETQFLRLVKFRSSLGLKTKVLLLLGYEYSNQKLLEDVRQYAEVYTLSDIVRFFNFNLLGRWSYHLSLLAPLNNANVAKAFKDVIHIHVTNMHSYHLAQKISSCANIFCKITIGVYHSGENTWGGTGKLPFYEFLNRKFLKESIQSENVFLFNESVQSLYVDTLGGKFKHSPCFPLGVIDSLYPEIDAGLNESNNNKINIVSIGRLESFKTYNMWMLDVVDALRKKGMCIHYDIYGSGNMGKRLQNRIIELNLSDNVTLKGTIPYSYFDDTVKGYDLFVGSGTAIIQSAANGIPSIIGIENNPNPTSYGFISQIDGFAYNEDNLYEKVPVLQLIEEFANLSSDSKNNLRIESKKKAAEFAIDKFHDSFVSLGSFSDKHRLLTGWMSLAYTLSFIAYPILLRLSGRNLGEMMYASKQK